MILKFVNLLEKNLEAELQKKTSWGRVELTLMIQTVIKKTLLEILE